jgi:hypothetical protein
VNFERGSQISVLRSCVFDGCRSLKSVCVPSSITDVSPYLFGASSGLSRRALDDGTGFVLRRE